MNTKTVGQKRRLMPKIILVLVLLGIAVGVYKYFGSASKKQPQPIPMSVKAATAKTDNIPVYFNALGTVTPPRTVTVKSRVDGELIALHFTEGRRVKEGELLAEIDPRPFEVQKAQALGALARDEAQLKDARLDLERYRKLIKERSISQQQLQAQEALVGQYEGAVLTDKAAVDDAELQLTYSRITAPVSGRVGLRKVDVGNIVRSSDSDGIVVITQMQPMQVVFTLVEKQIPEVLQAMRGNGYLEVEAWGQSNKNCIARGTLRSLDNQIDTATGTVKAKAEFENTDEALFPNQFVNIRLRVKELKDVLTIPTSAVQRNIKGFFVYVVENGRTRMREIEYSYATDLITVVEKGLNPGDVVVTDGVDRLRDGSRVNVWRPSETGTGPGASEAGSSDGAGTGAAQDAAAGDASDSSKQLGKEPGKGPGASSSGGGDDGQKEGGGRRGRQPAS